MKGSIPSESWQMSCFQDQNFKFFRIISEARRIISEEFWLYLEASRRDRKHLELVGNIENQNGSVIFRFFRIIQKDSESFRKHPDSIHKHL